MIRFYGYKKCGTSRKGEAAFNEKGKKYEFIDITVNPPSEEEIKKIHSQSGLPIQKLFNTSGKEYRDHKIKDKITSMSEKEIYSLLAGNGRLIKRPLVSDRKTSTIGFDEELFRKAWKL